MRRRHTLAFRGVTIVLGAWVSVAQGDGGKFPEAAIPVMPAIPQQRALIAYRDGVETLVVESTYDTDSPSVGWVLPLPAEPTKLEVADSGMLTSLSISLRPRITHDLGPFPELPLGVLIGLVPFACVVVLVKRRKNRVALIAGIVFVELVVASLVLPSFGLPGLWSVRTMGMDGLGASAGIVEISRHRVGNYNVSVLKATESAALSRWLERNSLRTLDETAREIVDDYVSREWCFVVARLRKDIPGTATPHPIAATFPTQAPTYPMKLTALSGSITHVELFVVADRRADADRFECIASDRYNKVEETGARRDVHVAEHYQADKTDLIIGSPEAGEYMWPGCVVTKLAADLSPHGMDRDVEIVLRDSRPYREHFYSPQAARGIAKSVELFGILIIVITIGAAFNKRRRADRRELLGILILTGIVLLTASIVEVALPTRPVQVGHRFHPSHMRSGLRGLEIATWMMVYEGLLHSEMSEENLARFPQMAVQKGYMGYELTKNFLTGEAMRLERSPGNFSTRKVGDKTFLCLYDYDGRESRIELPPPREQ